jgi:toxin HigB-1
MSIVSFRCIATRGIFVGKRVRHFQSVHVSALRKLAMLDAATKLEDLRIPPGNRLELLRGDRAGHNDQYRICFSWTPLGPANVEICDYH